MTDLFDHPTARGLLAAARRSPGDDTPRLLLADHLDEAAGDVECGRCRGDGWLYWNVVGAESGRDRCHVCGGSGLASDGRRELAELIRVQCEIDRRSWPVAVYGGTGGQARLNVYEYGPDYDALRERQRDILDAHGRAWSGRDWHYVNPEPGATVGERASVCVFRRGFADLARFPDVPAFLAAAPTLLSHCPLLQRVEVADREPQTGLSFGDRFVWLWPFGMDTVARLQGVLPDEIFRQMARLETSEWRIYDTRDEAFDGLSAACLSLCESLASPPAEAQ